MRLNLLIDTSVWLDLAKDPDTFLYWMLCPQWPKPTRSFLSYRRSLLRNLLGIRIESWRLVEPVFPGHFKRVREAIVQFAPEEGLEATLKQ